MGKYKTVGFESIILAVGIVLIFIPGIPSIFGLIMVFISIATLIYLLCKYLKLKLKQDGADEAVFIHGIDMKFIQNHEGDLLLNSAYVKSLLIQNDGVFAELISGDTYLLKQCENYEEAKAYKVIFLSV